MRIGLNFFQNNISCWGDISFSSTDLMKIIIRVHYFLKDRAGLAAPPGERVCFAEAAQREDFNNKKDFDHQSKERERAQIRCAPLSTLHVFF